MQAFLYLKQRDPNLSEESYRIDDLAWEVVNGVMDKKEATYPPTVRKAAEDFLKRTEEVKAETRKLMSEYGAAQVIPWLNASNTIIGLESEPKPHPPYQPPEIVDVDELASIFEKEKRDDNLQLLNQAIENQDHEVVMDLLQHFENEPLRESLKQIKKPRISKEELDDDIVKLELELERLKKLRQGL